MKDTTLEDIKDIHLVFGEIINHCERTRCKDCDYYTEDKEENCFVSFIQDKGLILVDIKPNRKTNIPSVYKAIQIDIYVLLALFVAMIPSDTTPTMTLVTVVVISLLGTLLSAIARIAFKERD